MILGDSLVVQWLRLSTFTAVGLGSIPSQENKILQNLCHGQKKKKKKGMVFNNSSHLLSTYISGTILSTFTLFGFIHSSQQP